ncbi:MAG: hypothetical protein KF909_06980 [Rhodocyclaceae bacterium]|nr:hypothetical protein [Rhodocyclaceae bacterium]MCP5293431.1 hypothetical protein [Zoogloeaceae bacterium]
MSVTAAPLLAAHRNGIPVGCRDYVRIVPWAASQVFEIDRAEREILNLAPPGNRPDRRPCT